MTRSERYSDGGYLSEHQDWHDGDAGWKAKHISAMLRDLDIKPDSLGDVGCGTGGVLDALRRDFPGARMVGYEVSPQAMELGRREHPDVEIHRGTADDIQDHFDLVMALDVFEHVDDYFGFLRSLHGKADRYLFHIPLDMNAQMVLRGDPIMRKRGRLGHLHYFSRDTGIATLRDAGYRVISERYTPISVDKPQSRLARLAIRPRQIAFRANPHLAARALGGFSLLVLAEVSD